MFKPPFVLFFIIVLYLLPQKTSTHFSQSRWHNTFVLFLSLRDSTLRCLHEDFPFWSATQWVLTYCDLLVMTIWFTMVFTYIILHFSSSSGFSSLNLFLIMHNCFTNQSLIVLGIQLFKPIILSLLIILITYPRSPHRISLLHKIVVNSCFRIILLLIIVLYFFFNFYSSKKLVFLSSSVFSKNGLINPQQVELQSCAQQIQMLDQNLTDFKEGLSEIQVIKFSELTVVANSTMSGVQS